MKTSERLFVLATLSVAGLIVWMMASVCFAGTNRTYTVTIHAFAVRFNVKTNSP